MEFSIVLTDCVPSFNVGNPCASDAPPTPQRTQMWAQIAAEEKGVEARSLAHNPLRGRGAGWSFGMGLGRIDNLHSLTRACTRPSHKVVSA